MSNKLRFPYASCLLRFSLLCSCLQVWPVLRGAHRGRVESGQDAVHLGLRSHRGARDYRRFRRWGDVHEQLVRHVRKLLQAKHGEKVHRAGGPRGER